ncbi:hypothetical protein BDW22DRAFT_304564 [Trametopsis cervina]|nr:hypothetical protein BDW22DRAFT_304564 [Trametopsis cervina]
MATSSLSALTLVEATPEQEVDACKRTHVQWSRGMGMKEYIERDRIMSQQEHSSEGKWKTWVLVPRDNPTTLDFMCSCETFRRKGVMSKPGDTHTRQVICYGVASVFTPASKRGHGYASHMMRLLHWVLAPHFALPDFPAEWGSPPPNGPHDAQFSVLYSDVGSDFYHNCGPKLGEKSGWTATGAISTSWAVTGDDRPQVHDSTWDMLTAEGADYIWEADSQIMAEDVLSLSQTMGQTTFSFLPNAGVGQFTIQRCMQLDADLKPILDDFWGISRVGHPNASVFATWTFEPGTKTMVLTRLRASPAEFPPLLTKIKEIAATFDKDTVEAWNLPCHLKDAAERTGGQTFARHDHLSSVKWYGPEPTNQIKWAFNEKFSWC